MINVRELSNGIKVVIETVPNVRSVALGIYVRCGSAYENERNNGISHMIEHMMFKGTSKRTAKELARETALLGDDMNAYTSKEITCFYARVLDEHLPAITELLSDMFLHSVFSEEDLEREKSIILDEIDMYDDAPEDLVQEQIQKLVWKEHPLGYIISGTKENVLRITRQELYEYWKKYYVAENMIISIAGNIDERTAFDLMEKYFAEIPRENSSLTMTDQWKAGIIPPHYASGKDYFDKDTEQVHLCLGYPGISHDAPENHTLAILNNIIGGSSCSRLFQQIREDKGLCYSIYSYGSSYSCTGTYQIYAAMGEENVKAVYNGIMDVIKELRMHGPTSDEMEQTISQIRSELLLARENTHNRMHNNARNLLYRNRIISVDETMEGLLKVTRNDIYDFMDRYLDSTLVSVTMAGNFSECAELQSIFNLF